MSASRSRPARRAARVLEQIWSRPTAEVNGIWGGYTGDGFKTVIAGEAIGQDLASASSAPRTRDKIRAAFRAFVSARLPADCTVEFHDARRLAGDPAALRLARLRRPRAALSRRMAASPP